MYKDLQLPSDFLIDNHKSLGNGCTIDVIVHILKCAYN